MIDSNNNFKEMASVMNPNSSPFDTTIYVRVKRFQQTFFVVCDEFEEVAGFKARLLDIFT